MVLPKGEEEMSNKDMKNVREKLQALGYFGHSIEEAMKTSDIEVIDSVIIDQESDLKGLRCEIAYLKKQIAEKKFNIRNLKKRKDDL